MLKFCKKVCTKRNLCGLVKSKKQITTTKESYTSISNSASTDSSSLFQKSKVLKVFLKVFDHFFGSINDFFNKVEEPRLERADNYPLASLLFMGISMFLTRIKAVRQIKYMMNTEHSKTTFKTLFRVASIPHGSTLNGVFSELDPDQIQLLPTKMVRILLKKKVLDTRKFLGKFTPVAIDGTGVYKFKKRHCEHCLTKKDSKTGKIKYYYHMVLEAKLVTRDGLALSLISEFVENPHENPSKQDCETKAFHRLAEKLKKAFPKLPIILILDGLFAEGPMFQTCKTNKWEFMIVLKDKDLSSVNQEFRNLKVLQPENSRTIRKDGVSQCFTWCNEIDYWDTKKLKHRLNVLECREIANGKNTKYQWISSIPITSDNVAELARTGRSRWVIENQGFNVQKNLGFEMEHPYTTDPGGMKVYYYLLQIAHTWVQLCERGSLLKRVIKEDFGALKNLAFLLLEEWRNTTLNSLDWVALKLAAVQIRFAQLET